MSFARRHAAARNGLAAIIALAIPLGSAAAENGSELLLPLVTAIALASASQSANQEMTPVTPSQRLLSVLPAPREHLSILPSQLRIPDGYAEDIDLPMPRYVSPIDSDRIVSVDLFRRPRRGWMASVAYDEEKRAPLPGTSTVLSFVAEFHF